MFKLIAACALLASACADVSHILRPQHAPAAHVARSAYNGNPAAAATVRQLSDVHPDGSYQWSFETENGIAAQEEAQVRALGPEEVEKVAQGSFSWVSPEGEAISMTYTADANGYQPQGSHLPVAPAIPAAIQRALAYIAAHPQPEERLVAHKQF